MIQFRIGRSDNGLGMVVRFRRNRDDRLRRVFRLASLRRFCLPYASVDWQQVLRSRVIDHVRAAKHRPIHDVWVWPQLTDSPDQ